MTDARDRDTGTHRVAPSDTATRRAVGAPDFPLDDAVTAALVRAALEEDAAFHDVSTLATVVSNRHVHANLVARHAGVVSGIPLACAAFKALDNAISIRVDHPDGSAVVAGDVVLRLNGHARALLSAERVALNYLQRLSGIATLTSAFVRAVAGSKAQVLDTRKTTPGWRSLEKYAVRCGGGVNHRADLRSGVLIKDNHLSAIGGDVALAVQRARGIAAPGTMIQVECDTLLQVHAAAAAGADAVLLDNMTLEQLREAVAVCGTTLRTEASGGVTLQTVAAIAACGVDRISVGALTHSAPALDLGLDFDGL